METVETIETTMPSSMTEDEVLPIVMWTVATTVLLVNIVVLILGVVRKREIPVDAFLIHNLLFCYLLLSLHPYVILTMDIILRRGNGIRDTVIKTLCSFASFVGVATSTMCMWTMVTLAASFLLRLLLPRRFKNLKTYLNALRIVLIAEWVLVGLFAVIPLIPYSVFEEAQSNSRLYLCLPLHTMLEPMWVYTLVLASTDGLSIIILLMLVVVTACQLHKQQRHLSGVTPMEARLVQKNAALVKRVGLMMLSTVAFRFPGVVAIFGANLSVDIPMAVFQWVFGIVLPFSGIIGPVIYVFYAGLEDTTLEACWHSCRKRAVKGGSALRLGLGQLTGGGPPSRGGGPGKGTELDGVLSNGLGPHHAHDTLPRGSNRAPSEASWVESITMPGRQENHTIVEWATSNGSPRRGLLQTFHPDHYQQWKTEALTLSRLQSRQYHPHIVECLWHSNSSKTRLDRAGAGKEATRPVYLERYICTTYYPLGCLQQFLPHCPLAQFSESVLHSLACQVSSGLAFLHEHSVVHTKLESSNIMVGGNPEGNLKVVISNFTSAIDYAKPPRQEPPVYRARGDKQEDKSELMMPRVGAAGKKAGGRGEEEGEEKKKPEFSNDVRSFALLLLEMMAWLKQKKVDAGLDEDVSVGWRGHHGLWDRPDAAVIGARLAGEGCVKQLGRGGTVLLASPHASQDSLDAEAAAGRPMNGDIRKAVTDDEGERGVASPKRVYYANQACSVEEMRSRRAMSDAGVYRKILSSRRMEKMNNPQRPRSGVPTDSQDVHNDIGVPSKSRDIHIGQEAGETVEKLIKHQDNVNAGYHSNHIHTNGGGEVSNYNRNNQMGGEGFSLRDNPRLAATFPRRSMMTSDILKSEKRHSLCSSDSGISSPRNSMRSNNKGMEPKKVDSHLLDLNDRVGTSLSDSEAMPTSAVSKLRGMLGSTPHSIKAGEGSTDGDSCQEEDSMLEYGPAYRDARKWKAKQAHSCPSDTGSDDSKSDTEKTLVRTRMKSCDHSDSEKETNYESDRRMSSGEGGETRSTSSLSKFYVRKKSITPFTAGIPESLTPPCSRPVSRASSAASLLDVQEGTRAKSCYDGIPTKSHRKYSLGALKHEGNVYGLPGGVTAYGYSTATLPKDHPSRSRCRTMDGRSVTLSRAVNLQEHQVVMARSNGWGYSHFVVGGGAGGGVRTLPQAMHNGEHFFISTVPSGVIKQHVVYGQQLLKALPCLRVALGQGPPGSTPTPTQGQGQDQGQEQLLGVGETHVAVMDWLSVIRESDSCLNKQLLNILKACWTREPCPDATDVHCMLGNCVTEVPL